MAVEVGELLARMKLDTSGMKQGMDKLAQVTQDIQGQFDSMRKEIADIGPDVTKSTATASEAMQSLAGAAVTATTAAGVALLGVGANATRMAIAAETSFAEVRKTVNATDVELQVIKTGLRGLAEEVPSTVNELNKIAGLGGQLGISKEAIVDFTKTIAMVATSTNMTADNAATAFARIGTILGVSAQDYSKLGSAVVDLGNKGNSTETEIANMALRLSGTGKTIGLTAAEVLGVAAAMANVGLRAEMGGTAMSKVMMKMAGEVSAGGKGLEKFAEVAGISADDFAQKFKAEPAAAIAAFVEGLGKIQTGGGDLFKTLAEMGFKGALVSQTLQRMASSSGEVSESLDLSRTAWQQNTALSTEAGKKYETVASQMEIFRNKLSNTQITLGEAFLPMMIKLMEAAEPFVQLLGNLASGFAGLDPKVQIAITGFVGLMSSLAPIIIAAASLVRGVQTLLPLLTLIGGALATPAALFLGLAAAVIIAYQNMEKIGEAVAHASTWFNELVTKGIQSVIDGFKNMGKAVVNFTVDMKNKVVAVFSEMIEEIKQWMGAKLDAAMNSPAAKAVIGVINKFIEMKDKLVTHSVVPEMVDEIGTVMGQLPNQMVPPVDKAVANIQQHMETLDINMNSAARRTTVGVGNALRGGVTTWSATLAAFSSTAISTWGSISQTVGTNLAKMTDEEVKWGEVTKQIGLQVMSNAITTAIGVTTQWAISQAMQLATQTATDSARVASSVTADAAIVSSTAVSAGATTSIWGGASAAILGFFGAIGTGFAIVAGALVTAVTAVGTFIMTVLGAIATGLSATIFGIPFAIPIFAAIALIAAALALGGGLNFLAEGGVVTGPTLAMIGERGPEAVIPLDKAGGFGGGRGSQTIIVQMSGREVAKVMGEQLPDLVYVRTRLR